MTEKQIEQKLVKAVKEKGGLCWKFTSPGTAGVPDRIVLMPEGHIAFVELKAPSKRLRVLQEYRMKQLITLGSPCYVIDNAIQIPSVILKIGGDAE